jgi:hypothetical protein
MILGRTTRFVLGKLVGDGGCGVLGGGFEQAANANECVKPRCPQIEL